MLARFFEANGYDVHVYAFTKPHPEFYQSQIKYHEIPTQVFRDKLLNWFEKTENEQIDIWRPRIGGSKIAGWIVGFIEWIKYKLRRPISYCVNTLWGDSKSQNPSKSTPKEYSYAHILRERFGSEIADKRKRKFNKNLRKTAVHKLTGETIIICHDRFSAEVTLELSNKCTHIIFDVVELLQYRSRKSLETHSVGQVREIKFAEELLNKAILITVSPSISNEIAKDIPMQVIYNGRPQDQWVGKIKEVRTSKCLAFSGAFFPGCGLKNLLDVLHFLPSEYSLLLVGHFSSTTYRTENMRLISKHMLGNRVQLIENANVNEIHKTLSAADLYVLPFSTQKPNLKVSMPNRLFDAIAAGLPILSQNHLTLTGWVEAQKIGANIDVRDAEQCAKEILGYVNAMIFQEWQRNLKSVFLKSSYENQMRALNQYLQSNNVISQIQSDEPQSRLKGGH